QAGRAKRLGLIDESVDFTARVATGVLHDEAADGPAVGNDLAEHSEARFAKELADVLNGHPTPQVGLVGAVLRNRLGVRHARKWRRDLPSDHGKDLLHQ